jgi:hypothetical protein
MYHSLFPYNRCLRRDPSCTQRTYTLASCFGASSRQLIGNTKLTKTKCFSVKAENHQLRGGSSKSWDEDGIWERKMELGGFGKELRPTLLYLSLTFRWSNQRDLQVLMAFWDQHLTGERSAFLRWGMWRDQTLNSSLIWSLELDQGLAV